MSKTKKIENKNTELKGIESEMKTEAKGLEEGMKAKGMVVDVKENKNNEKENNGKYIHVPDNHILESGRRNLTVEKCYEWKDRFRFDLSIQRNEVWKKENKSLFIHSMMLGYPINFIYTMDQPNDNFYWVLDGKQRLTTFFDFLEDKFALTGEGLSSINGEDVAGKLYSELSEDLKTILNNTDVTVVHFKGLSREQRDQLFYRLNNGESLSKMEQTRALSGQFMDKIAEVGANDYFKNRLRLSAKARSRFKDIETVLQSVMLFEKGSEIEGLGSLPLRRYVNSKRDEDTSDLFEKVYTNLGYIEAAVIDFEKKENKMFRKTNVPVIFKVADKFKKEDLGAKLFGDLLVKFFITDMEKDSEYSTLIKSGSAGKENVLRRVEILENFIQNNK